MPLFRTGVTVGFASFRVSYLKQYLDLGDM